MIFAFLLGFSKRTSYTLLNKYLYFDTSRYSREVEEVNSTSAKLDRTVLQIVRYQDRFVLYSPPSSMWPGESTTNRRGTEIS